MNMTGEAQGINIYRESALHAALKAAYALPGDRIEAPVSGYVADILRSDADGAELCIEVQTGSYLGEDDIKDSHNFSVSVRSDYITGIGNHNEALIILLDTDRIMSTAELSAVEAAAAG